MSHTQISMYSPKSFFWLLAMLSTVFSSRNLLSKQFSCKLHIKQQLCTYTASFALLLAVRLYCYEKYFSPALTGIWRQPDVSSAFLMFRLGSAMCLEHMLHLYYIRFSPLIMTVVWAAVCRPPAFLSLFFFSITSSSDTKNHMSNWQFYCLQKYRLL